MPWPVWRTRTKTLRPCYRTTACSTSRACCRSPSLERGSTLARCTTTDSLASCIQLIACSSVSDIWIVAGARVRLVNLSHLPQTVDSVSDADIKFRILPAIIRLFKDADPSITEEAPLIFGRPTHSLSHILNRMPLLNDNDDDRRIIEHLLMT